MRSPVRQRTAVTLPGVAGTARVDRHTRHLLPRLRPGDVAVLDHLDLDRATAQALVDAGVVAVVDAAPMISGRYPNLGPQTLVEAGIAVVDSIGAAALAALREGRTIRVHDGAVHAGEELIAQGRELDEATVATEMDRARSGMVAQLAAFTHSSSELLRREQDLLLHGLGLPRLSTRLAGRPVVVVAGGHDHAAELASVRAYAREQHAVLIGVGAGAEALRSAGLTPDVVVLDARAEGQDLPRAATLKGARDVVVRVDRGGGEPALEQFERLGVRPSRLETSAAPEDAALVLAAAADAAVIVAVGMRATLEELLDSQRSGLAGAYLARLAAGPRLVDAEAVTHLYSGRVRPRHLLAVLLAGLVALAAAIAVTPVGQEWVHALRSGPLDTLLDSLSDLYDYLSGLLR